MSDEASTTAERRQDAALYVHYCEHPAAELGRLRLRRREGCAQLVLLRASAGLGAMRQKLLTSKGGRPKLQPPLRASRELTVYIALAGVTGNSVTAAITETVIRVLATATAIAVAVTVTIAVVTIVAAAVTGVVTRLRNVDNEGYGICRQLNILHYMGQGVLIHKN